MFVKSKATASAAVVSGIAVVFSISVVIGNNVVDIVTDELVGVTAVVLLASVVNNSSDFSARTVG